MNYTALSAVIFLGLAIKGHACTIGSDGPALGGIELGEKSVAVEIKQNGKSRWVIDDDGMLTIGLVAAHCSRNLPIAKPEVSETQKLCAETAQQAERTLPANQRIHFDQYEPEFKINRQANNIIQQKCNFSAQTVWEKAQNKINSMPLECGPEAKEIVKRAAARTAEYARENTVPEALKNIKKSEQLHYKAAFESSKKSARLLDDVFSKNPTTVGDFTDWVDNDFSPFAHTYSVVETPEDSSANGRKEELEDILAPFQAKAAPVLKSRCPTLRKSVLATLSGAKWLPRNSSSNGSAGSAGSDRR